MSGFALIPATVFFGWSFALFGAVFGFIGLTLLVSRIWASYAWVKVAAHVAKVESGDPPTLTLRYDFGGDTYVKEVTETSLKSAGNRFVLFVNPKAPQQSISHSFTAWFLGGGFVVFGLSWVTYFPSSA